MIPLWIAMFAVWAIVEFVQYLRKRPLRSRMKTGAIWGVIVAALSGIDRAPNLAEPGAATVAFVMAFAIFGLGALAIYWGRVALAKAL